MILNFHRFFGKGSSKSKGKDMIAHRRLCIEPLENRELLAVYTVNSLSDGPVTPLLLESDHPMPRY